jgi:pimeloyl-ACP methyl ester carboxylesterase
VTTAKNFILFKNIKIYYTDSGQGNVVVLLHGFLENQKMWYPFLPHFISNNRVISIDLLGHGDSECIGYVHTMEENATMVQAVLQHLKIKKTTIVGHSMGGYVGLAFADVFTENLKALVLLNSTARADSHEKKQNRSRAIQFVKTDYESFIRLSIANLFNPENRETFATEIENTKIEALKTPLQGIIASLEGMKARPNREFLLQNTTFEKLLILGKKDPILNYIETSNQVENSNTELITLPDGHMSHIENFDELLEILTAYFNHLN